MIETSDRTHAAGWADDGFRIMPRLPGTGYVQPLDINRSGDVVGQIQTIASADHTGVSHAYLFERAWEADTLTTFKLLSSANGSAAVALNDLGGTAGYVVDEGSRVKAARFTRKPGHVRLPDREALFSSVTGINSRGDLCGSYIPGFAADEEACAWIEGHFLNLNEVTDHGGDWHLVQATGINDRGQIVGYGIQDNRERAFLLDPVPGARPASWPAVELQLETLSAGTEEEPAFAVLRARPSDGTEVSHIAFYREEELLGTVDAPPYEWGWQGRRETGQAFHAVLTDQQGRTAASPSVSAAAGSGGRN
jgi:uncharacterized membrane protein